MPVELDHPAVVAYVARLEEAAGSLPPGLRAELVADIRAHLGEGLGDVDADDPAAVQEILDRLGDPADIVAEELREAGLAGASPASPYAPPTAPSYGPSYAPPVADPAARPWGWMEFAAAVLLTVGSLLFVVGPALGLVFTWASDRWNRRQKQIATGVGAGVLLVEMLLVPFVFFSSASSMSVPEPAVSVRPPEASVSEPVAGSPAGPTVTPTSTSSVAPSASSSG